MTTTTACESPTWLLALPRCSGVLVLVPVFLRVSCVVTMLLGQISYLDCAVFVLFLVPQLLLHVNTIELILCALRALPFLLARLPLSFIKDRIFVRKENLPEFVRQASPFQDFVIRCVRYAFAYLPANVGQAFFSRAVALPFLRFRLLRHGYLHCPVEWHDIDSGNVKGVLIQDIKAGIPDVVVYYCHGGGFAMGSSYFYLEPMLALYTLLKGRYKRPAIFSLEYSLVPHATYPTQMTEVFAGYNYVKALAHGNSRRICVAGDSAGCTLVLSLLLHLAKDSDAEPPGYAFLLSPWVTLATERHKNTRSDYLDANSLERYGRQYAGSSKNVHDPLVSPGCCRDLEWWKAASPLHGLYITWGSEEVFAPEIRAFVKTLRGASIGVRAKEEPGAVHAWVIASLFLADTTEARVLGMRGVVDAIASSIGPSKAA